MMKDPFEDTDHSITHVEAPYTGWGTVVEIWCPQLDERKSIIGDRYVRNCPMCGDEIDVSEKDVGNGGVAL